VEAGFLVSGNATMLKPLCMGLRDSLLDECKRNRELSASLSRNLKDFTPRWDVVSVSRQGPPYYLTVRVKIENKLSGKVKDLTRVYIHGTGESLGRREKDHTHDRVHRLRNLESNQFHSVEFEAKSSTDQEFTLGIEWKDSSGIILSNLDMVIDLVNGIVENEEGEEYYVL
jgi:hypothetical protein